MRNVAVCSDKIRQLLPDNNSLGTISINGMPVTCGLIQTEAPEFRSESPEHQQCALIKTLAFSCNYRDRSLILRALHRGSERTFYVIGSEFVGQVVEVGAGVTGLEKGDRVIGNNHYLGPVLHQTRETVAIRQGIPTNHASREFQILPESALIKIPADMSNEVAAAFSIGGQTSYSMIRKLDMAADANVLVTGAGSNTSLFVINALQKHPVNVYAVTTSARCEKTFKEMGVEELIFIDGDTEDLAQHNRVSQLIKAIGGFDYIIDPFFNVYLPRVMGVIAPGGKYVTCGLTDQWQAPQQDRLRRVLSQALVRNLQIIANCIGLTSDLVQALHDYAAGSLNVVVDSVFSGEEIAPFLDRTYNATDRFGKVVYCYE